MLPSKSSTQKEPSNKVVSIAKPPGESSLSKSKKRLTPVGDLEFGIRSEVLQAEILEVIVVFQRTEKEER